MPESPTRELVLKLGEDYSVNFYVRVKKTKVPVDIQNLIFKADIKKNIDDPDSAIIGSFTFSAPFEATTDDGTAWIVTRSISAADILALGVDCAMADQFGSDDGGTTWTKWRRFVVKREKKVTVLP